MQLSLQDRIKGGLYGVAVGDALGGTTEFMSREAIRREHGYLTEIVGGGVWSLAPGEVTDDTMMTIAVAEGILEHPADPVEAIGERFLAWYRSDPKDIGNIIRLVFSRYRGNWPEAARSAHLQLGRSAGNGSLMRCLPAALAYGRLDDMERVTAEQSEMTHHDPLCREACLLYNRIAWRLLEGGELRSALAAETKGTRYEPALGAEPPDCPPDGYVVHTLRWVLHLLNRASSFEEAVQEAANGGDDSDTVGAIAGGLAGIYWGYSGIPARYTQAILVKDKLDELAERLAGNRLKTSGL
ncbi:ADP-ribosylglycohydrolase family protein [Paenibacillus aurantius]|uniref:ADP-ribosylglycohydrolase family protein n=1 Tax=Paenibacillus aurantius TaxID=2918900 RepID=A0AA96RK96_9BACL|nr:ADP-ribosylglycohydrolase family protein [Paenibacillus aurantius]WNQ14159.1 ADP-ribosylglycohydrolase family protein [Paenibacillus aurantius]